MTTLNNKSSEALGVLSFLFSPVLSLLLAIKNFRAPWAKNIVWAFIAFYAYHFSAAGEGVDIVRYIENFRLYSFNDYSVKDFILSAYVLGSSNSDILEPLLSYSLSKITSNYKVLLMFYGLIYGYFYSRNIWFFLDQLKGKIKFQTILLLLWLLVTIGIWEINGFRFWSASHIFIYGAFNVIFNKKRNGVLFLFLSIFMHIGMAIPVLLVLIFRYVKIPSLNILFPIFIFTFFIAELDLEVVRAFIGSNAPEFIQKKLLGYTSEAYVEDVQSRHESYSITFHIARFLYSFLKIVFILVLYLNRNLFKEKTLYLLFKFIVFFSIFSNLLSQIPSGGRYSSIANFLLIGCFMLFIQNTSKFRFRRLVLWQSPLIILMAIYYFRIMGFYTFNIHHFVNNPIVSFFIY